MAPPLSNVAKGFLLVHILAALWFATGLLAGSLTRAQGKRAQTAPARLFASRLTWRLTKVFTLPGLIAAGLIGAALVTLRGYSFHLGWVFTSMILYLTLLVFVLFFLTPHQWKTAIAAEASEGKDPQLAHDLEAKLPAWVEGASALMTLALVVLMTIKP